MGSKAMGARYGHIKRLLSRNEPLTGKHLELALDVIDDDLASGKGESSFLKRLRQWIVSGEDLDEYEYHVFVEVMLLHKTLGS